jgi:hypothetical protein
MLGGKLLKTVMPAINVLFFSEIKIIWYLVHKDDAKRIGNWLACSLCADRTSDRTQFVFTASVILIHMCAS